MTALFILSLASVLLGATAFIASNNASPAFSVACMIVSLVGAFGLVVLLT
jgi:hypothetical protein